MSRPPTEIRFCLCIRSSPDLRHHSNHMFARHKPGDPSRHMKRRLGAKHLRKCGKPFPDLGRVIVHDVVDVAGLAALDSRDRCRSGIIDMYERPPSATVTDQRHAAMTEL